MGALADRAAAVLRMFLAVEAAAVVAASGTAAVVPDIPVLIFRRSYFRFMGLEGAGTGVNEEEDCGATREGCASIGRGW